MAFNFLTMLQQFNDFKNKIQQSGKDPNAILNDLIKNGQVTQQQLDQAKSMANMLQNIFIGGRK